MGTVPRHAPAVVQSPYDWNIRALEIIKEYLNVQIVSVYVMQVNYVG